MTVAYGRARALMVGVSVFGLSFNCGATALAQDVSPRVVTLDVITVVSSKTEEQVSSALAPVSVVTKDTVQRVQPNRMSDLFYNLPGVWLQDRGDDPSTSINIRGLQDFGRVAVIVDGARQNYQRTGHNANGSFFLDPELISSLDIARGPTANIYGSGAIGGVASFSTKDIGDVVRPGERWGADIGGMIGSNKLRGDASAFAGAHVNPNVDVFGGGVYRTQQNYKDGDGTEVGNTWNNISSGLFKLTLRPADGHEIKFGTVVQKDLYNIGQNNRGETTTAAPAAAIAGTSVYASDVTNYTNTLGWKYSRPDDNLFDWNAKVYFNRTENDQTKIYNNRITTGSGTCTLAAPGNNVSGCVGDPRSYLIDTPGFDIHNTSRLNSGNWRHAFTYGIDGFQDTVSSVDVRGNSNVTTPGGRRTVSGGFLQWKGNYSSWLEVIGAARYDNYRLNSGSTSSSGSRLSPKITVGVTPIAGVTPYVSYAEGYRAPSITETVISGAHATGGGPALFVCPDGTTGVFCFVPNPNLRPEVGKNKEAGLNLKFDNMFAKEDSFRAKINAFQNDITDYIDAVQYGPVTIPGFGTFNQFYQYQNIPSARIHGFELESMYDAGGWFIGVNASLQKGTNSQTGIGLVSIQPRRVTTTAGMRFLDRKLTISGQWASIASNTDIPAGYLPSTGYDLINLYASYQASKDVLINLSVDNILDKYYRPYAVPGASADGTSQNDALWTSPGPGITYKAAMKVHFGAS
jgi:hemoglobin/transferrin/lactoferrin receptor protein